MREALLLTTVLVLAATVRAGDEANPEFDDPEGDAGAGAEWGDITTGWVNETAGDIVVTFRVAHIPPVVPDGYVYYDVLDVVQGPNTTTFGCFAFFTAGQYGFGCAHWDRANGPQDQLDGSGTVTPGEPGTVVLNLPRTVANNATAGTVLTNLALGTGLAAFVPVPPEVPLPVAPGTFVPDDGAEANRDYALAGPAPPTGGPLDGPTIQGNATGPGNFSGGNDTGPAPGGAAPRPTPGLAVPLAVAALGLLALARRRR